MLEGDIELETPRDPIFISKEGTRGNPRAGRGTSRTPSFSGQAPPTTPRPPPAVLPLKRFREEDLL